MTHIYLATRMPQHVRDIWLANMRSASSNWKREILNKKGKPSGKFEDTQFCWNIKPLELWEIVVPDEAVNEVLWYNGIYGNKQVDDGISGLKILGSMLRKALKLKPIPNYQDDYKKKGKQLLVAPRIIYREGGSIYGIGIKKDDVKEFPQWGYRQEAL